MIRTLLALLCGVLIPLWPAGATAQTDTAALVNDTQRMHQEGARLTLVWWIPNEYWEASAASSSQSSPEQLKQLLAVVDRYVIVAVVDGELGTLGSVKARPLESIISAIQLIAPGGTRFPPLGDDQLSPELRTFFQVMKPMLSNMLGQVGKGLEFIAFDGRRPGGGRLLDPRREESFTITFDGRRHDWRLPLGSLLPPAMDTKTGERFPGNYRFNPYTGDRLRPR
ncbi:MAG: hypothetical protein ACT4P9_01570 [Betaproteobacteria bacterium]